MELVRNGCVVLGFFAFSFSKRANWQHVCDCEKVGDAVRVQNSAPRLPPALLGAFQLP